MTKPAVVPDITPPSPAPTAGINLRMLETILLPSIVAPPEPNVDETKAVRNDLLISSPNITVIALIIEICVGTSRNASARGTGVNPSPKLAATAVAIAVRACFF